MRVLIIDTDIFHGGGGGQTFYRKLIADNAAMEFTYFRHLEPAGALRPSNAHAIPLGHETAVSVHAPLFFPERHRLALRRALSFARAAAGGDFDIVDVPDYNLVGPYLRNALAFHDVGFRRLVLSMHGVLSDSVRLDWCAGEVGVRDVRELERLLFVDADHRYAISARYAADWRGRCGGRIDLLDPLNVLDRREPPPATQGAGPPELLCVGRRERRKGNDLAIEIAAWLDPDLHAGLRHIGAPGQAPDGRSSDAFLAAMSTKRNVPWRAESALPRDRLLAEYDRPVLALFPVRYDTFNLAALEAVSCGAPVAISIHAGVCDFLDAEGGEGVFLKIDPDHPDEAASAIAMWLRNFSAVRRRALDFAALLQPRIGVLDVSRVYAAALSQDSDPFQGAQLVFASPRSAVQTRGQEQVESAGAGSSIAAHLRKNLRDQRARLLTVARTRLPTRLVRAARQALAVGRKQLRLRGVVSLSAAMNSMPEGTSSQVADKIEFARAFDTRNPGRALLWAELARLERLREKDLRAAGYDMRAIRLAGGDRLSRLPLVHSTLAAHDLTEVADVFEAAYGSKASPAALRERLDERCRRLRTSPGPPGATLDRSIDGRPSSFAPRVSVIVSVYEAGPKIARFVRLLSRQTLNAAGQMEVIFIDAASPHDEWAAFGGAQSPLAARSLYLRTTDRITIQAAWNLGLQHARGAYVTCLGVDETLYPDALEVLADRLDREPDTDWAMASSVVTEVTQAGAFLNDKAFYNRTDASQNMAYLDTTYVSWVGGLYRRTIHERFGYYDPAFRAAGDTEFKMRVLSRLKVSFVDRTLGVFMDYPDARASASVRAEVEDQLAWYAHRTPTGAARLFENATNDDLASVLAWCAGRRKCFGEFPSTDVELGVAVSGLLAARPGASSAALELAEFFSRLRSELRAYDFAETGSPETRSRRVLSARWRRYNDAYALLTRGKSDFSAFNDNRFEQHSWVWGEGS